MKDIKSYFNHLLDLIDINLIDSVNMHKIPVAVMLMAGFILIITGIYISKYSGSKIKGCSNNFVNLIRILELVIFKFPLKVLAKSIDKSLNCLFLKETTQRWVVSVSTVLVPITGICLYGLLHTFLTLWYARLITLTLCLLVPYYMFTLLIDYLKYDMNQKIPSLIDGFRSSFVSYNRIKPALKDCSSRIDARLGAVALSVSDTSDLNSSLCQVRDRIDNTWFNIFTILLINYRENGGRLIGQLYKLSKCITRYNNVEKKKNRRLIWYEVFVLGVSIFSLPSVIILNRMILGNSIQFNFDTVGAFSRIAGYSVLALVVIRILRRM